MSRINHEKEWILTASQKYTPTGVLQLGQILTDYADPESAILTEGTAPIPNYTLMEEPDDKDVNYRSSEPKQTALKAWLKIVSNISTISEINSHAQKVYQAAFEGRAISEIMFQPSKHYVETALSLYDTSGLTSIPWYVTHSRVWVVTGLRIVGKRTKISEGFINHATGHTGAKGDGNAAKGPSRALLDIGYQGSDLLIYCYRLHEIILRRSLKTTVKPFGRGGIQVIGMNIDNGDNEEMNADAVIDGYEVISIENEAFKDEGMEPVSLFIE